MKPATPGWTACDPEVIREQLVTTSASSAALGLVLGLVAYHFLATPVCALEAPRAVAATIMAVGQHLCKDWEGIRNVVRVSDKAYTFTCERYATFSKLDVNIGR